VKKLATGLLAGTAALALGATALPTASASPTNDASRSQASAHRPDNRPGPLTKKQDHLRQKALSSLDNGSASLKKQSGGGATVTMAKGPRGGGSTSFEFPVNRTDKVFTILAQFSDLPHNSIAKPDRSVDNSTYWEPNFDKSHYDTLFNGSGESFSNYYQQLSSGRYDVSVGVSDWVTVPGTGSSYGANSVEDDGGSWDYITDAGNAWYSAQVDANKSATQIHDELAQYDQWDRYDYDNDGNYNEPDGYIDHFQAIHSGEGEEAGGGTLGDDAIWSHRWYVNRGFGTTGPTNGPKYGGTQIGDSGLWIGDYTVEPENGGLGVFAHEFGHDLGLPDYYDTNGGDNGTGFWTLMSAGSWLSHGSEANDGIGTTPGLMGPEEKLELGWLDYSEVDPGKSATVDLGPSQHTYDDPQTGRNEADQAVKVNLPDKTTTMAYTTPPEGTHAWWGGRADGLNNTLTRPVGASSDVTVNASAWYDIEQDYDFLYGEYSVDNGQHWLSAGPAITGSSSGQWVPLTWTYNPGGQASLFRFRYYTDGGVNQPGAFLDAISVDDGSTTFTDGAESGTNGWTVDGWSISTGTDTKVTSQYYLMENRQYVGYDDTLRTGPYNFSEAVTRPNWVEFFPYQTGMLVWYVDMSQANNNTSSSPGHGAVLPVDARPAPFTYGDGTMPGNRRQPFDATFGLDPVAKMCLHKQVAKNKSGKQYTTYEACAPASAAIPTFYDSAENAYWSAANPWGSTKLPASGVKATVTAESADHFLTVSVKNP
jgi:immune inhibitor A